MTENKKNYIQNRLNKLLENRLDGDKETLEALETLEIQDNTLESRRNLRSQIEKKSLIINQDFLNAFQGLALQLDVIVEDIFSMTSLVNKMQTSLRNTQAQTYSLIQQTNQLQNESNKLIFQNQISKAFLNRFQLTEAENKLLYENDRDKPITSDFFKVLDRIFNIHSDCKVLIQSGYQTVALDIMEEMTLHQECALEKLYRWTQNHCRSLDSNEIGPLIVQAMNKLQDRPVLFKYVIDEYSTTRRALLVRNFIDALTVGGPNGNPKAIEMHAHDPKRYIGDMLAWLHQSIPSERDNLMLLLKNCEKNDISDQVQTALINITDGVCHPLKVRVETILNSEKQTTVLYAVANLIRFYKNIIKNTVKNGNLEQCLADLEGISEETYLRSLSFQVSEMLGPNKNMEVPKTDLVPPQSVGKLLNILKEVLSVANMVEGRQSDIKKLTSCIIDPLLESVSESASHLPTIDMAVYMLNCIYEMHSLLAVYEYTEEKTERLQAQTDAQLDTLISEQASSLVANLNLGPIYTILQSKSVQIEINYLKSFNEKFNAFLEFPDILLLNQISLMSSSSHRNLVRKRSFNVIIAIYQQLYDLVQDSQNETLFSKTPEVVTELLNK